MTNLELEHLFKFEPKVGPVKQSCIRDFIFAYAVKNGFSEDEAVEFTRLYIEALFARFGRNEARH